MTQYRNVPTTIDAEQYTGPGDIDRLRAWGCDIHATSIGMANIRNVSDTDTEYVHVQPQDWVIRGPYGFSTMDDAEFRSTFVRRAADDEMAVTFRMVTTEGREVRATVEGWTDGRDAVRALMHVGKPQVVIEFVKEQIAAGDMSMLTLMNELAELANPGE